MHLVKHDLTPPLITMKAPLCAAIVLASLRLGADTPQNLVTNGDFESGANVSFWGTPGWYNLGKGLNQGTGARSEKNVIAGAYSAGVSDRYDAAKKEFTGLAHSQITTHIIQPGDTYTLSFDWRPVDDYWQRNRDTVRFIVYATDDDTLRGQVVWSAVVTSDFFRQPLGTVKTVVDELPVVGAAAHGKKLLLTFHGIDTVDGVSGSPHFAKVDNIFLTLTPSKPGK